MRQSLAGVKHRRKTGFKIDHAILAEIFGLLIGHPLQRLFRLHHRDGVGEAFKIFGKAPFVSSLMKPLTQRGRIAGRKLGVFRFLGQIDDGLGPQYSVQMLVQKHFGQAGQLSLIKLHKGTPRLGPEGPVLTDQPHRPNSCF